MITSATMEMTVSPRRRARSSAVRRHVLARHDTIRQTNQHRLSSCSLAGPSHWGETFEQCNGEQQSPIDIDKSKAESVTLPPLKLFVVKNLSRMTMVNNGHTSKRTLIVSQIRWQRRTRFFHTHVDVHARRYQLSRRSNSRREDSIHFLI